MRASLEEVDGDVTVFNVLYHLFSLIEISRVA